ncbi:MAG TPA: hypothetical protein VHY20_11355 [Pirellulales bacterium]|jgi:hypothetical protein|nr:hypothetical protein [Pirellulales bacterium]
MIATEQQQAPQPEPREELPHGLAHFLRLALRGRHRGSSGGEKSARKLALAVLDGCNLDETAREGLIAFIRIAAAAPETARDAVDYWGSR